MATRKTKIGKPKKAFTAIVKEAELALNFSIQSASGEDNEGNPIQIYVWVNGDWKVNYKDKEYIIPLSDNITALVNWINGEDS